MKITSTLVFLLSSSVFLYAQVKVAPTDTIKPGKGPREKQLEEIKKEKVKELSDSTNAEPKKSPLIDTTVRNKYGDLLNDDRNYNKRSSLWVPLVELTGANVLIFSMDRFLFKYDFSTSVGLNSWKHNLNTGWEWDRDRFGINFIGHPYSGTLYFNAGRSNGYNYFQSATFAGVGSLMWEYFGENTLPSYNDIINTPINGAFLGEILYRISSNILDDRTRGINRFSRELLAGIIDPMRGFNRLIQGKSFRITNKEVYQKEPLNITVFAGYHREGGNLHSSLDSLGTATNNEMVNLQFDYGNPFERRARKPFDFFRLRTEFSFHTGRKILDNVTGYGILFGKNMDNKKQYNLLGAFQYYDYWDNKSFELGAIAFGGGLFSMFPISKKSEIYTSLHIAVIPFAGNSRVSGPDTSQVRDYDFGNGLEGKFESTINLGKIASISLIYYYYIIHTTVGAPGNNLIGIFKPKATVHIYKGLSIGFEQFIYNNDRYLKDNPAIHSIRYEQKLFLQYFFEDKQRRGQYN